MPDVVVNRVPTDRPPRRSRSLDERLAVRFPTLNQRLSAFMLTRLNPRSRLRQTLLRRATASGWAAFSRRDFELMLVRYAPDVEFRFSDGLRTLGLDGAYRGHDEMLAGLRELTEGWTAIDFEPVYVLDLGDVFLNLGLIHAQGRASGVQVETEIAQAVTVNDGLVASDRAWDTWEAGLEAVGLDPDAVTLPRAQPSGVSNQA